MQVENQLGLNRDASLARETPPTGSSAPVGQVLPSGPSRVDSGHPDVVQLSGASDLIALAKQAGGDLRSQRIAELSAQVREGKYQASSTGISEAMVKESAA